MFLILSEQTLKTLSTTVKNVGSVDAPVPKRANAESVQCLFRILGNLFIFRRKLIFLKRANPKPERKKK